MSSMHLLRVCVMKESSKEFIHRCPFHQNISSQQTGFLFLLILPLMGFSGIMQIPPSQNNSLEENITSIIMILLVILVSLGILYAYIKAGKAANLEKIKISEAGPDGFYIDIYKEGLTFNLYDAQYRIFDLKQKFVAWEDFSRIGHHKGKGIGNRLLVINFSNTTVMILERNMHMKDFNMIKNLSLIHVPDENKAI